ncbi:uncharacterized protein LOC114476959 [Gouania willdenowi]|uniref:uncharacterized protein LOC114476959 n=1 Tax=Gouania willdenowi TaxID=441366 RepID=UPI001054D6D5|nr:uncharacterized protein LOC114476959 [Gouania willdenowi]
MCMSIILGVDLTQATNAYKLILEVVFSNTSRKVAEEPFRSDLWEEAMWNCSGHLPINLTELRKEAKMRPSAFFEAWEWSQLAGLLLGQNEGWNSFDSAVMGVLVIPHLIAIPREDGSVLHKFLAYPLPPEDHDGLEFFNERNTFDWKGKIEVKKDLGSFSDEIRVENMTEWGEARKEFLPEEMRILIEDMHIRWQMQFFYSYLTKTTFGKRQEWMDVMKMYKAYKAFLQRIEYENTESTGEIWIKPWAEKLAAKKYTLTNEDRKIRHLLPDFLHTIKKHHKHQGEWNWQDFIQSPFPYQMTFLYTTERSLFLTAPINDWNGEKDNETIFKKWLPLTPDAQWHQLRWSHEDESWNLTITEAAGARIIGKKPVIKNGETYVENIWNTAEVEWQPCRMRGGEWECLKDETLIQELKKTVNSTYAFASHDMLTENRRGMCVIPGKHVRKTNPCIGTQGFYRVT